ncbi:MAG TPA: J domain-containing protein [Kofleriaceae bacterium]|nr:J domain-containing protein [Kofleriaceae bacterium]
MSALHQGDDVTVQRLLEAELERLRACASFAALGLPETAGPTDVRARFLELTHTYHPNRFARRAPPVLRLANEVFLLVRKAYELASDPDAVRRITLSTEKLERLPAMAPKSQPKLSFDAALVRKRRELAAGSRNGPSVDRTPAPAPMPPAPLTEPLPALRQQTQRVAAQPPATSAHEVLDRARKREEEQQDRFRAAVSELRAGKLARARDALRQLVVENPHEKRYRCYFHYAAGREHHASGRSEEARAEYERSLGFDPKFEAAQQSLALLTPDDPQPEPPGRLSRWFKR